MAETAVNYRRAASGGAYAAGLQQGIKIGMQVLTAVVLSRLLSPDTFGVYAMVTPVSSFVALFQDMGLQQAVIQRKDITPELINRLYWLNFTATIIIAVFLVAISPLVGWFYHDDRVIALTAALAVPVVLGGIVYQHHAVMQRNLRFQRLAVISIACAVAQFATVLVAAWLWHSYWAFWLSGVVSVALFGLLASRSSGWKPGKPTLRGDTGGMLRFGAHLTGANLIGYFARNLDNVLIGHSWGPLQLGFYDRAYKLLLFPMFSINGPLNSLMMPVLSRLQAEPERMRQAYYRFVALVNLLIMPGVALAVAAPHELITLLLGAQWELSATIFGWLGIVALFQPMTMTMGSLMIANGRGRLVFWLGTALGGAAVLSFLIGLPYGPLGVAKAYVIEECLFRLPLQLWVVTRGGEAKLPDLLARWLPQVAAAGATYLAIMGLRSLGVTALPMLVLGTIISYVFAIAILSTLPSGRGTIRDVWLILHDGLSMLRLRRAPAA